MKETFMNIDCDYVSPTSEIISITPEQSILQASGSMRGEDAGDESTAGF